MSLQMGELMARGIGPSWGVGQRKMVARSFTRPKKAARGGVGTREAGERYRPTPR